MRAKPIICQVNQRLPYICCGEMGDAIYRCEEILPHDRHTVGEHTILHARLGNGYSCSQIEASLAKA